MRTLTVKIIILIMLFGVFGCRDSKKKDFVFDEFKSQIEKNGMKIDSVDEMNLIYISHGELTLKVSLDNLRKDYERDKDLTIISNFVKTLDSYSIELPSKWEEVKEHVYISFFSNDFDVQEGLIHTKVTDEFGKVYVYRSEDKFTWITKDDLEKWNITENELNSQVDINANKLLERTPIVHDTIENRKLGLIEAEYTSLKGALLFSSAMKEKVKKDFGFPFYAVFPVRDFCYIFSENDFDYFSTRIGKIVVDEYKNSGYPITTELLKFSEKGIESVGKYPVD